MQTIQRQLLHPTYRPGLPSLMLKIMRYAVPMGCLFFPFKTISSCSLTTTPVSFGIYNVYATTNPGSSGQITVTCNPANTPYTVALNGGSNGTISQRKLKLVSGSDTLSYNLYTDATRSTLWGDGTTNGVTVASSNSTPLTVYGAITVLQDVSVGTYTDSVTVTATF